MDSMFHKIATMLYENKKQASIFWLVGIALIIGLFTIHVQDLVKVGGYSLPGTEFYASSKILNERLGISSDKTALVIFNSDRLKVYDELYHDEVIASLERLKNHPLVEKVETFYETGIPDFVSKDNHTLYAIMHLKGSEEEIEKATVAFRERARSKELEVSITGVLAANYDIEQATAEDLASVEIYSIPLVLLILFLFLKGLVLGLLPIVVGGVSIAITLGIVAVIAFNSDVSIFAVNISTMVGLGLTIDFSLIALDRFRTELCNMPCKEAIAKTLDTAGRSILLSGITLFFTMIVWSLFPVMIIRSIALAISLSAVVAVFTALLLMPLLLSFIGPKLEQKCRVNPPEQDSSQLWKQFTYKVMDAPWLSLLIALSILFSLAYPITEMNRRGVTLEAVPPSVESRHGGDILAEKYGKGTIGPIMIAIATHNNGIWDKDVMAGVYDLHQQITKDTRVQQVRSLMSIIPNPSLKWAESLSGSSVISNPDYYRVAKHMVDVDTKNSSTVLYVFSKENEVNPETVALLKTIRANINNWAPTLKGVQVYVGGAPAMHYDFGAVVDDQAPVYFAITLIVNFLTLFLFFKSLIIPIKAVITNLLSLLASFGVLVIVFQYGFASNILGTETFNSITFYTPIVGFAILYGLSTDYEVFLMSRIREYFSHGASNEDSVASGVQDSAKVITTAGLIMIVVFGSFAFTQVLVTKELGLVLAAAIFIDMTIVRFVVVPASMRLMGAKNWWLPKSIDNLLPDIRES